MSGKTKKTILLVEDEALIALSGKISLEKYGYEVVIANNGEKAVEIFRGNKTFDLILMDINLGDGIDGTETAKIILKNWDVPIVFLSSHTEPEIVEKTEKITSYGYVVKNSGITVMDASIKMAFKLFDANRKTLAKEERYRFLVENLNDVIFTLDMEGIVTYASPQVELISQYRVEEVIGRNFTEFIHPEDLHELSKSYARTMEGLRSPFEFRIINKDLSVKHMRTSGNRIMKDGRVIGMAVIMTDITERTRAEAAIKAKNEELEAANEELNAAMEEMEAANEELIATGEELRESEEKFSTAFRTSPYAVTITDPIHGKFIEVNEAFFTITGYTREEALIDSSIGLGLWVNGEDRDGVVRELARGHKVTGREIHFKKKNGEIITGLFSAGLITLKSGKYILSSIHDITGSARAQDALRENEERLNFITRNMIDMIAYSGKDGSYKYISPSYQTVLGYSEGEMMAFNGFEITHPDDRPGIIGAYTDAIERKETELHYETRLKHRDGHYVTLDVISRILYDDAGGLAGGIMMSRDITGHRQAEAYRNMGGEILKILNEPGDLGDSIQRVLAALKTRTGFDAAGIRLEDGDDFPYYAQKGFSEDFLLAENSLVGRTAEGGVCRDKDGGVCLECTCGLVISGKTDPSNPYFTRGGSCWSNDEAGAPFQDTRLHPRDRCLHDGFQSVALVPIRNKDRIVGLIQLNDRHKGRLTLDKVELLEGIASHIGAALMRRQAEEALRESEEKYRLLVENSHDIIYTLSPEGVFTFVSPAWTDLLGHPLNQVTGHPFQPFVHPDDIPGCMAWLRKVMETGQRQEGVEYRARHIDGSWCWHTSSAVPLRDGKGVITGFEGTARDITARKLAEEKIKSLLMEKELILKEVHHRIKNTLSTIRSLLTLQAGTLKEHSAVTAFNDAISRVQSMAVLYDKLYKSVDNKNLSVMIFLPSLVDEIIANFPNRPSVKIEKKIDDFILDAKRLQTLGIIINEILTNIMKYAFAGRSDGLITVSASLKGHTASIAIEDNGNGMPEAVDFKHSTGLGLMLVGMLTKQMEGAIRIEREHGTRIVLEFEK